MRQYNKILVIIEPKKDVQLALLKAIELAKYNPKVSITALRLIYDFANDVHFLTKKNEIETHEDVKKTTEEALAHQINVTLKSVEDGMSFRKNISSKVEWTRDISEGMVEEANSGHYDLIIKAANHHGLLDSIIFTPHDWNLLRHAHIPVVIAKETTWDEKSSIVVAVDFTSSEKQAMNVLLLREAQLLSHITHAPIHLVNSAPVVMSSVMMEVPNYAPELYAQSILAEHKRRIVEFAKLHQIPEDHCHIAEGMPDEVIPKVCHKLNAKAVFIGSIGRSGVTAAFVGNTCEEIVDYIKADLFVLNRKTLASDQHKAFTQE